MDNYCACAKLLDDDTSLDVPCVPCSRKWPCRWLGLARTWIAYKCISTLDFQAGSQVKTRSFLGRYHLVWFMLSNRPVLKISGEHAAPALASSTSILQSVLDWAFEPRIEPRTTQMAPPTWLGRAGNFICQNFWSSVPFPTHYEHCRDAFALHVF